MQGPEQQTLALRQTIWAGLDEGAQISATMKAYPVPAATGEWNWVVDAKQADTCHTRISAGWDRYANIKVSRP